MIEVVTKEGPLTTADLEMRIQRHPALAVAAIFAVGFTAGALLG